MKITKIVKNSVLVGIEAKHEIQFIIERLTLANYRVNIVAFWLSVVCVCVANSVDRPSYRWMSKCHCHQYWWWPFSMIFWNWCAYPVWYVALAFLPYTAYPLMMHQFRPNSIDSPDDTSMHHALNSPTSADYTLNKKDKFCAVCECVGLSESEIFWNGQPRQVNAFLVGKWKESMYTF